VPHCCSISAASLQPRTRPVDLASQLRDLNPRIFPADGDKAKELSQMLEKDTQARLQAAAQK